MASIFDKIRFMLRVNTAGKVVQQAYKAGIKTTEFWLTFLVNMSAVAMAAKDILPDKWAAIAVASANFTYALSRGLVKISLPNEKPAWQTTEFRLNMLQFAVPLLAAWQGVVDPKTASALSLAAVMAHNLNRALSKQPGYVVEEVTVVAPPAKP